MGRKGKMLEKHIDSKYLQETMTLKLYLPEFFTPLYKYHVCIMQDGNDYFQMGRVATKSDELHDDGEIENTIFVGIHYEDRFDRRKKYHPAGEQQPAYMKFLAHEVIPFLDDTLPTYQMGQARTLMGDSLAGTLALMTALRYPNIFGRVVMQSPYVDDLVLEAVANASNIPALDVYHSIGTSETAVKVTDGAILDFLEPNRRLHEELKQLPITYHYKELEQGEHTWKYWQNEMSEVLTTMFG
ncbi:esterase family protein [Ornithinibacillus gellani]|uniref:alpha/beta hydrolase n=1 Tax=Ornithinibacillus gellani TaxID=2293253 RepID=UPI000F4A134B|nr:alpha/beta hydrolase-fold protein [Ornithinibacillus gellani]TQS75790.1 esterase family protein [Ornithinibacillus gellani]